MYVPKCNEMKENCTGDYGLNTVKIIKKKKKKHRKEESGSYQGYRNIYEENLKLLIEKMRTRLSQTDSHY